jgi:hypothetical protein
MYKVITLMVIVFSLPSWATVVAGANECPTQFEGRVKEIIRPVGPSDVFSVDRVVFENDRTLKGEVSEQVVLEVLQNGPYQLEVDRDYRVQVRNGKVCWIEDI